MFSPTALAPKTFVLIPQIRFLLLDPRPLTQPLEDAQLERLTLHLVGGEGQIFILDFMVAHSHLPEPLTPP